MLSRNHVSAVMCSTDLERSRDFYEKRLGFVLSPKTINDQVDAQQAIVERHVDDATSRTV
jgi:catechol 2,3-dioxygenase-like lactoylglutathione lyase family enzyme